MSLVMTLMLCSTPVSQISTPGIEHSRDIDLSDGAVRCVAASSNGELVAGGGDRFVQVFRVRSGERVHRLSGHTGRVISVSFSSCGTLIASGSQDKTTRIWNVENGECLHVLRRADVPRNVAFSPDDTTIVVCSPLFVQRTQIQIYDARNGQWLYEARQQRPEAPLHLAFAPDGKMFAIAKDSGNIALLDVVSFGVRDRYTHNRPRIIVNPFESDKSKVQTLDSSLYPLKHDNGSQATHVAFSSDSRRLLSSGDDNTIRIWDAGSGDSLLVIRPGNDTSSVVAAEFSTDASAIVSVTGDELVQVWRASDGELLAQGRGWDKQLRGMTLLAGGSMLATCGSDRVIRLWNLNLQENQESGQ